MAMEAAMRSSGERRVAIVPVGLSYSHTSASVAGQRALVDFGRPIYCSDDQLRNYMSGEKDVKLAVELELTKQLDRHLRDVTIAAPYWIHELEKLCHMKGLPDPQFEFKDTNHPGNLAVISCELAKICEIEPETFTANTRTFLGEN